MKSVFGRGPRNAVINRRSVLQAGLVAAALPAVMPSAAAGAAEYEPIALWPGDSPGGTAHPVVQKITPRGPAAYDRVIDGVNPPMLALFRPARPNGTAILLAQGGGYVHIAQSAAVIKSLTDKGITVFDLSYRLPGDGWNAGPLVPLQDAQRAMRRIRARAVQDGILPNRIGVMGFSAGGHVAASLATRFGFAAYDAVDGDDALSARPDFACLSCPVITMEAPFAHGGSRQKLLGPAPTSEAMARYSCEKQVSKETPPCFLVHADDDGVVPADNSLKMVAALRQVRVPAELHLFREGGHGMGTNLPKDLPASTWPALLFAWMERYGYLGPSPQNA
ncbi:MAG: alpha/beta hydrolase [Rhizomicrobium sp.]